MKKLILHDEEYAVLQKVLQAIPVAHLTRLLPECDGGDIFFYRGLLKKVLHKDFSFPDTDDGMKQEG